MINHVNMQLISSVSDTSLPSSWGVEVNTEMLMTFWPLLPQWSTVRQNAGLQEWLRMYEYTLTIRLKSHARLPQYLHTVLWPLSLFYCFFSLSRHLTENTNFLNLHHHGNLVSLYVTDWLTHSLKHTRLLYIGRYTQQTVVTLFTSASYEQCTK
jgi:hypothetical protein